MPELPEVENIAEGLRNEIIGLSINGTYVKKPIIIRGPFQRAWRKGLARFSNRKIATITRRGKRLILIADNNLSFVIQLGMTGRILLKTASDPIIKHTHFIIDFFENRQLRFIDPRRFGRLWLLENLTNSTLDQVMEKAGLGRLGPEPFEITLAQFRQLLTSKRVIKNYLLDQTCIAGLGNIYTDEALYAAGIHPARHCYSLKSSQSDKLLREIRSILKDAIRYGGTTFSDYRNAYGNMGSYMKRLKVYQRTGLPCKRCQDPIQRIIISGRSSHFCPNCQR